MTTPAPTRCSGASASCRPGTAWCAEARRELAVERWWDLADAPSCRTPELLQPRTAVRRGHVRELLTEAVRERLMADVPFGVFLSGGVDSSAITALVRQLHDGPLRTFSVGYSDAPGARRAGPARGVAASTSERSTTRC